MTPGVATEHAVPPIHTAPVPVLDHGYVRLVGTMLDLSDVLLHVSEEDSSYRFDDFNLDEQVVRAARTSYQGGTKATRTTGRLIDYLIRHHHTSPFEMVTLKFQLKMPLFVVQQWLRHRTASINQESARYSELSEEFYRPDAWRSQDQVNKQGSAGELEAETQMRADLLLHEHSQRAFALYRTLLEQGVAREQARMVLPPNTYTTLVWEMDLHNLMHFLRLRTDPHAQWETRQFAEAIHQLVRPLAPLTFASFENHVLNAVTFSGDEVAYIRGAVEVMLEDNSLTLDEDITTELPDLSPSRRRELAAKIGEPL